MDMSKTIQVRDVPDQVHSTLKARAARPIIAGRRMDSLGVNSFLAGWWRFP
jgi:hypothetical protein